MKMQYYTKANINGIGNVLLPYSGTFNTLKDAKKWYKKDGVKLEKTLLIERRLILAEAIEEIENYEI